ncbi:MAG: YqeG family HAD IIIA-type phosphatase [Tenericutes bacterium]|nr:MAG: YqeG family HAD IIIA-type phosphatase [Mycoplasmatota bacterium]
MEKKRKTLISNYFKPSIYVQTFKEVNVETLKRQGIKLFISDLDNTLIPHFKRLPNKEVLNFIEKVRAAGMEFAIMSNNIQSRVSLFAKKAGVEIYRSNARKPFKRVAKNIIKTVGVKPEETIIMGDQIIMDILVANRLKAESILVNTLVTTDYKMNSFNTFLEKSIYRNLSKRNILTFGKYTEGDLGVSYELL